jgi:anti-sigma regulatory factor (Ser/Thr protein kinase)
MDQGVLIVLGDATGHGLAPALSVTQMQAMLRMAFRLGANLETAFREVNNQLSEALADDRFITAFVGLLNVATNRLRFHSGGQAPILHFEAASRVCARHNPTSFPLAAMPLTKLRPAMELELAPGDILVLLSDGFYEYHDARNEQFGEERVEAILTQHHGKTMAQLSEILFDAVAAFARGAPQDDDMTVVLVKRNAAASESRQFPRSFAALQDIFAFTAGFVAHHQLDAGILPAVDLTVEELFTNMVKYSPNGAPEVRIDMQAITGGVEVTLTDYDVERFDVTRAPDADIHRPIEERRPGGLGLHLIRRLVDAMDYEYSADTRCSRIRFRKTSTGPSAPCHSNNKGDADARD